jgi:glutathione S-transferase
MLNVRTNDQKKDWFLSSNPNGRVVPHEALLHFCNQRQAKIPILVDNTKNPPFPVMETSAELLYLLKEYDAKDVFGFKRSQCPQWLLFWHGSVRRSGKD